jgi:hypothetical protein
VITIRNADFRIVATSRNLRGLLTYARTVAPVSRVDLYENKPGATWGSQFGITFADGSSSISDFAQFSILCEWVETRRKLSRGWFSCEVRKHLQGETS